MTLDLNGTAVELLRLAEMQFGPRVPEWQIAPIGFRDDGPIMFYPTTIRDGKQVYETTQITLHPGCLPYHDQMLYQLSHETVHVLAPNRNPPTIMLEEGMAVYFSIFAPEYLNPEYRNIALQHLQNPECKNYRDAFNLFNAIMEIDEDIIRALRSIDPYIFRWSADFIQKHSPDITRNLAEACVERRQMR